MTDRELRAAEAVIDWAVAPEPPLPPVAQTGAVAAFVSGFDVGPRAQRLGLRVLLLVIGLIPPRLSWRKHGRVREGPAAPLIEALAALAQLAYYGDPTVLDRLARLPSAVPR